MRKMFLFLLSCSGCFQASPQIENNVGIGRSAGFEDFSAENLRGDGRKQKVVLSQMQAITSILHYLHQHLLMMLSLKLRKMRLKHKSNLPLLNV